MKRNMTVFKDSSDLDSKGLPAYIALIETNTGAFAAQFANALI